MEPNYDHLDGCRWTIGRGPPRQSNPRALIRQPCCGGSSGGFVLHKARVRNSCTLHQRNASMLHQHLKRAQRGQLSALPP